MTRQAGCARRGGAHSNEKKARKTGSEAPPRLFLAHSSYCYMRHTTARCAAVYATDPERQTRGGILLGGICRAEAINTHPQTSTSLQLPGSCAYPTACDQYRAHSSCVELVRLAPSPFTPQHKPKTLFVTPQETRQQIPSPSLDFIRMAKNRVPRT